MSSYDIPSSGGQKAMTHMISTINCYNSWWSCIWSARTEVRSEFIEVLGSTFLPWPLWFGSWHVSIFVSQNGLATKVEKSRKQMKERKNRAKKIRGVKKVRLVLFRNQVLMFFSLSLGLIDIYICIVYLLLTFLLWVILHGRVSGFCWNLSCLFAI